MNEEKSELTEEERELLRLLDADLDLPPLSPDFESNVLAQLGITSSVPLSETDTGPELTEEERELLRLLDDEEDLDLPPLPPNFEINVLARLGIPSDVPSSEAKAEPDNSEALFLAGLRALRHRTSWIDHRGDETLAVECFHKAAEQGHAGAQFHLGLAYSEGRGGMPQDDTVAAEWFRKAAEQNNVDAQFHLGLAYYEGCGVPQNYAVAEELFRKVASVPGALAAPAQFDLALMHYKGEGVPQSYAVAAEWLRNAAEQDYADAQFGLGMMYYEGEGVPQDYAVAAEWFAKAAERGDITAQFNLGLMYYKGEGVPQSYAVAAEWFRKAAGQGHLRAQVILLHRVSDLSPDPINLTLARAA